ncbi:MAG: protein kinase, partial [Myxococcota bacterium]
MTPGDRIGEWVVEQPVREDVANAWIARQVDTPWRRVELRPLVGDPTDTAARLDGLTSLDHPHLEGLVGLAESETGWFVVSERRHGNTLREVWTEERRSRRLALSIGLAVTQAMWFAHQHGVPHGAVDIDHVWLGEDGRPAVVGWFTTEPATLAGDRAALAKLVRWLFTGIRPELSAIDDWVTEALDDPTSASLSDLRRSLSQLHGDFLGATTPQATPASADSTFFDEDTDDPPSESRMPHQIGRYVVVREIGRGGAGVVYEAIDPDLQRRVAVKVLLAGDFAQARDQQRFLNEARAVAQLDHPGIVHVLEFDRHEGRAWYAMDLVEGPNLLQVIRERGRLPWRTAVRLAASLARALHHAHEQGLVHRDVKPNNVLLESDQEPRLTDFGLALFTDESAQSRLTRTGQVLGTPSYMSPEQANGELHLIGPATDVYGVGVVLYEALTGRVPFEGDRPLSIIAAVVEGRAVPPRQLASGIPRQVEFTCLKAMQVDIGDRYRSAVDLAEDLERCLRGEPILATPPTLADQARWFVRRNRAQLGVLATAIGVALLILAASTAVLGARSVRQSSLVEAEAETALTSVQARIEELEAESRHEEADESWRAFARRPAHRGTQALVEGWWWRAEQLAGQGEVGGQVAALGMAYAAAERRRDQERALLR